ncbi:MAG: bifunctional glutamate N-acetyltransferase/amino-acid acetyltransferase ArgJ [Rhodobacteraceae bacterium]|nr:bifunctional glutamate N-acetyltransferase/amino-acid acetyltransferase ArgJ [Paracoccaceae bacterium]
MAQDSKNAPTEAAARAARQAEKEARKALKAAEKAAKKAAKKAERDAERIARKTAKTAKTAKAAKVAGGGGKKKAALPVSPLAPAAFPELPEIAGVSFAATAAGVRYAGRDDLMVAHVEAGASVAGVFTRSATRAAPVLDAQEKLARIAARGPFKGGFAILVNSGNANAFTGVAGVEAVRAVTAEAARAFGVPQGHVLTASTGVIGEPLPHERIVAGLDALRAGLSAGGADAAARAIMTTDTFPKGASTEVEIAGVPVRVMGFAKGSGMIAPDMATMLAFVFTDARISQKALAAMLRARADDSFNAITVDSDTSTSDTVLAVASNRAGMPEITSGRSAEGRALSAAMGAVLTDLACQVVRDGEGASKFVTITVSGASSAAAARKVAFAIANSPLVKTAIAGEDPNWGRIVMAVGKSGAPADRDRLSIRFGDIVVAEAGQRASAYVEEEVAAYMKRPELEIGVDLGLGRAGARVWTCDLTRRYIEINADYRS